MLGAEQLLFVVLVGGVLLTNCTGLTTLVGIVVLVVCTLLFCTLLLSIMLPLDHVTLAVNIRLVLSHHMRVNLTHSALNKE